jgi:hypothetical protein
MAVKDKQPTVKAANAAPKSGPAKKSVATKSGQRKSTARPVSAVPLEEKVLILLKKPTAKSGYSRDEIFYKLAPTRHPRPAFEVRKALANLYRDGKITLNANRKYKLRSH